MTRDEVMALLKAHRAELDRLGVGALAVFGSVARGNAGAGSDIDILVEFRRPVGLFEFVRVQMRLQMILGRRVDLVTPDALRPELREHILREAVYAA